MTVPAKQGLDALTEKEKATLRLIVRGHDAKSIARELGLSVHTINERLRDARRKMEVSSSRAAARLLFEAEGSVVSPVPQMRWGTRQSGTPPPAFRPDDCGQVSIVGTRRRHCRLWLTDRRSSSCCPVFALIAFAALRQARRAVRRRPPRREGRPAVESPAADRYGAPSTS